MPSNNNTGGVRLGARQAPAKRPGVAQTAGFTSGFLLPTQAHCPSTEHAERFCLLCFQPRPLLASVSARCSKASAQSTLQSALLDRDGLST